MKKSPKHDLVVTNPGFDYSPLSDPDSERVRAGAQRIRERLERTLEDIIVVGRELRVVKDLLGHGQFGPWLRAEFGWSERLAQNFLSVEERFGDKSATLADLRIAPTAAYLLAAPSVPDEARQAALERAGTGEEITAAVAREIVAKARKRSGKAGKALPTERLGEQLRTALERYRLRWHPKDLGELVRQLREFADQLDDQRPGKKKRAGRNRQDGGGL